MQRTTLTNPVSFRFHASCVCLVFEKPSAQPPSSPSPPLTGPLDPAMFRLPIPTTNDQEQVFHLSWVGHDSRMFKGNPPNRPLKEGDLKA